MARIAGRSRDKNRFSKKYPFVRAPQKITVETVGTLEIELLTMQFENESSKTVSFQEAFTDTTYRALISPRDTSSSDSANVSLSIDDSTTDQFQITVNASAPFTGIVDVIAMKVIE